MAAYYNLQYKYRVEPFYLLVASFSRIRTYNLVSPRKPPHRDNMATCKPTHLATQGHEPRTQLLRHP